MDNQGHYPDGLTEEAIERLMAEVFAQVEPVRRPTSPFASAEDARRSRRLVNHRMARVLPLLTQLPRPVSDGRAA